VAALPPDFTLLQVVPELETGGAEQTTIDVAAAVVAAGGRALVASRGGRMTGRLAEVGGELVELPMQSKNPLIMALNARRLGALIREERVSLVHARSRAPAWSALRAARVTGAPFVATYHGVYQARSALKRRWNAVMTKGDLVIANSEFTREHLLAEHGVDPAKVVTIPRGVDLSRFDPDRVSRERVKALCDFGAWTPTIPAPRSCWPAA
jgi:glycosyltransferase involved in cell wall biosynthesis